MARLRKDFKNLESQQELVWKNCLKIKEWENLKHIRNKLFLCFVRELHIYELLELIIEFLK